MHPSRRALTVTVVWVLALAALLPALFHWQASRPATGRAAHVQLDLGYGAGLLLCFFIYRFERTRLGARRAFTLLFLNFLLTSVTNNINRF